MPAVLGSRIEVELLIFLGNTADSFHLAGLSPYPGFVADPILSVPSTILELLFVHQSY